MNTNDPHDLVRSLNSKICPICSKAKLRAQSFCRDCYFKLPREMRRATYARLGHGYAEAITEAMKFLKPAAGVSQE